MSIFRSQLNKLVELLLREDFVSKRFKIERDLTETGLLVELPLRIVHTESGFYFDMNDRGNNFFIEYLPGNRASVASAHIASWIEVLTQCKAWMSRVTRELAQPDPWTSKASRCFNE